MYLVMHLHAWSPRFFGWVACVWGVRCGFAICRCLILDLPCANVCKLWFFSVLSMAVLVAHASGRGTSLGYGMHPRAVHSSRTYLTICQTVLVVVNHIATTWHTVIVNHEVIYMLEIGGRVGLRFWGTEVGYSML